MKAFRAFWLCALENGTTSAEDVWRGALRHGWKAALKKIQRLYKQYDMEDWEFIACKIKDFVDEELKDE